MEYFAMEIVCVIIVLFKMDYIVTNVIMYNWFKMQLIIFTILI